jgi:CRP/FNR family transcriptional regulator, cyclic AMP receptor protein
VQWPLLADLPPEQVGELLQTAIRRRFARNEVVFHRDDTGDSVHLISKGRFAIRIMTPLGETATLAVRGPGDSFGEMALFSADSHRSATVTALEEAETFAVRCPEFKDLRAKHPVVNQLLIRFLTGELRSMNERLLEALYVPVERRVLRRLVDLAGLYGTGDHEVVIPLTQEVMAEMAGTSRATVNRVLNEEQQRGTVSLQRGKTVVRELDDIRRRAR